MGFLNVSREAETHTIPNHGKNEILLEKYRKAQTSQSYGFLSHFPRHENSHSKGKAWENKNIPKLKVSYIFRIKQKSTQFPNHRRTEFPSYGTSMVKNSQSWSFGLPHRF